MNGHIPIIYPTKGHSGKYGAEKGSEKYKIMQILGSWL